MPFDKTGRNNSRDGTNRIRKGTSLNMILAGNTEGISDFIRFVLEIDKLKGVLRKVKPTGEDRYENTAEHSWQIALFALSLAQVVEISVDVNRVIAMLLVHDLGEIDAGDKFVFAQDG
jgi:putative hydrolase of HD superfamily